NENEDRVDADDLERTREATPAADVEDHETRGQENHGEAAGEEDEAAGPEFFVDGEDDVPDLAGKGQIETVNRQTDSRVVGDALALDEQANPVANERGNDRGERAQEPFGLGRRVAVVHVLVTDESAVNDHRHITLVRQVSCVVA